MHRERLHRQGRRCPALLVALLMAILAACGGGSGDEQQSLEDQLGFDTEGLLAREARLENLVRDCMKAQGWEYVPVDPVARRASLIGATGLNEEDFEKQYGYGITTLYEQRRVQATSGPNQALRAALSGTDQIAYDRALLGENLDASFAEALDTGDFSRLGGCTKQGAEAVFGGADVLQSLQATLTDLDARVVADPRMVAAGGAWAACMRARGFEMPGTDTDVVDVVLKKKLADIVGPDGPPSGPGVLPAYDPAALAGLQREEVAMVTADIDCEKQHIASVEEKVRAEYDDAFRSQDNGLLSKVPPT